MSETEQILDRFVESQGWTDKTVLDLALTYIENQASPEAWEDYLLSLKEVDDDIDTDWPEEIAHDYDPYDSPEALHQHLMHAHGYIPESADFLLVQGLDRMLLMHNQLHNGAEVDWPEHDTAPCVERGEHIGTQRHPQADCPAEPYRCTACGRPEDDCSKDPCAAVIKDRES